MNNIEEIDLEKLNKFKKIKKKGKTVLGVFACGLGIFLSLSVLNITLTPFLPTIEYDIQSIISDIDMEAYDNCDKVQMIKDIYIKGINSNTKLSEDDKQLLIESFCQCVVEPYGRVFNETAIKKMYVSAKTESLESTYQFERSISGVYKVRENSIEYEISNPSDYIKEVLAHEQVHAMLKNGYANDGFSENLLGRGVNEGCTCLLVDAPWYSYSEVAEITNLIGFLIGYDKLMECFYNSNLEDLENQISLYISKERACELITLMDEETNQLYNYLDGIMDVEVYTQNHEKRMYEIKKILVEICESKTRALVTESNIGNILIRSFIFDCDNPVMVRYNKEDAVTIKVSSGTHYEYNTESQSFLAVDDYQTFEVPLTDIAEDNFDIILDTKNLKTK